MARVAIARCGSYDSSLVGDWVARILSDILSDEAIPIRGRRVLVKPNLLAAREPERGVTTHPAVVGAVIDYLRAQGATVAVGDSPGGAVRGVERVFRNTGMEAMCREKGVELINFEAAGWTQREVNGRAYAIANALYDFDVVANVAKFKTHVLTLLTASVKNAFGCVPGFHKSRLHLKHPRPGSMSVAIVDVFSIVKPRINIMDAVQSMDGNGPSSGRVVGTGLLGASCDAVALDSVFAALVGLEPLKVPVIREAFGRGLGEASLELIELTGGSIEEYRVTDFNIPTNWGFMLIPGVLGRLLGRFVRVHPAILPALCTGCRLCLEMCPAGAVYLEGDTAVVDRSKCTSCLCCHEACPEGAVEVVMSRIARMLA